MSALAAFLRRNIVLVVSIPMVVAIHYSWYHLQYNENFVNKETREHLTVLGFRVDNSHQKTAQEKND